MMAAMPEPSTELKRDFAPCPLCKQYSHSIGDDALAEAILHFESMYTHPLRGTPMGRNFDERTRDMAQVLVAAAKGRPTLGDGLAFVEHLQRKAKATADIGDATDFAEAASRLTELLAEVERLRATTEPQRP